MSEYAVLSDLSDDAPAGENLEFDPDFAALDRACQGKPETQYGDTIIPAVPPEWKDAQALAESLLDRTRDLRVLSLLAMTRLNLSGLPAFAETVAQIRHLVEHRWDVVHPQLDPEDDNDPTLRANALFRLQDPLHVMRVLRDLPLVTSPMTGPVTWRDLAIFEGAQEPEEGREKMTEAFVRGAFTRTNAERFRTLVDATASLVQDLPAISGAFDGQAGYGTGPDLSNLIKLLTDIQGKLRRYEPQLDDPEAPDEAGAPMDAPAEGAAEDDGMPEDRPRAARKAGGVDIRLIRSVNKRDDAVHLLELASSYFRTNEPSSPLPMLIDRAVRLSALDFMDILRDLAPDGLMQAQVIAGPPPE